MVRGHPQGSIHRLRRLPQSVAWSDAAVDHNDGLPPIGATAACAACHVNGKFRGTPKTCVACHGSDDAHAGGFGTQCGSCHDTSAWKNATVDHNRTAFPLTGRHQGITCGLCHANGVYRGTPKNCISCHASDDQHNGAFGTDCASCHTTSGWPGATFNHGTTAFPLTGRHASATCAQCHVNGVYRGTPKTCVACHASDDAHNGAFGTNCASCHTTSGWAGATFNHGSTAFPLTGQHGATCAVPVNGGYKLPRTVSPPHASGTRSGALRTTGLVPHSTNAGEATFSHSNTAFR
jgi:hypothetical protein